MSPEILLWVFGGCYFLGGLGIAMAFKHQMSCNRKEQERAIAYTRIETKIDGLSMIFGMLEPMIRADERTKMRLESAEKFIGELRDMKHNKVDAYIPRAFDDLKKQVDDMEERAR